MERNWKKKSSAATQFSREKVNPITRSMQAYDAPRRYKLIKRHVQVGHAAQVSDVSRLVGVQRAVKNNGNVEWA